MKSIQTAGAEVYSKVIPNSEERTDIELFLFDLSGSEFYESIAMGVSKNPDLVLVVYDSTNDESLKNSLNWLNKVKKLNNKSSIPGVLVGTKT